MTVRLAIEVSDRLSNWMDSHHPPELPAARRTHIAGALFAIALDHRAANLLLLQNDARSAAFSMVRSIFEAYARGMWVLHCATDLEIEQFMQGLAPKLETIIKRLGKVEAFSDGIFDQIRRSGWQSMCSYAHGGHLQVSRWLSDQAVGPRHADNEVVQIVQFADAVGLAACLSLAHLAEANGDEFIMKTEELVRTGYGPPMPR